MIQDSGNRREFETGAVRDIAEGKGRCDLLPLDIVNKYHNYYYSRPEKKCSPDEKTRKTTYVFDKIDSFIRTGDVMFLYDSIYEFSEYETEWSFSDTIIEVSKHYEEGCKKYGERNWEKGIPVHCYIDSAVRHYLKFIRCDKDERHDRAFVWNLFCALWTIEHKPELCDITQCENNIVYNAEKCGNDDEILQKNVNPYKFESKYQDGVQIRG